MSCPQISEDRAVFTLDQLYVLELLEEAHWRVVRRERRRRP